MRIGIIDYGAGNMRSVHNALYEAGADPEVVGDPEAFADFDRLVLPGVGAATEAIQRLRARGMVDALNDVVRRRGRPLLGICLGMQLMAEDLLEFGHEKGLGWVPGSVRPLREVVGPEPRVPHMGWNTLEIDPAAPGLMRQVKPSSHYYFAHSFTLVDTDPTVVAARTTYHAALVSAIVSETAFAVQFHPEKSQIDGERLLSAFLSWKP